MKRILITLLLGLSWIAQAQENLIPNGGFEEYTPGKKPKNWSFSNNIFFRNDDFGNEQARSGQYCPKLYANAGQFYVIDDNYSSAAIDVQEGATYLLTYWYKGTINRENMELVVSWYNSSSASPIKRDYKGKVTPKASEWTKREVELTVPIGITKMGVAFVMSRSSGSGYILIDDVSLVYKGEAGGGNTQLSAPTRFQVQTFQREALLSWDKEADPQLQWEVVVDAQAPQRVVTNSFLVRGLEPETNYTFKVRAVKGANASEYTNHITKGTQSMQYGINDIRRVPHLRTLNDDGICKQTIDLFYNDLADASARITYFVNGKEVQPNGDQLTFPQKGKQKLKIIIIEAVDRQWEIEYDLEVQ
ncbi:fibronectin type III domain-containing protein [Capnocytophaga canis]|uniref:fibronectin type III domain-containing protein n=1 Tax=Capnocytophaga canis TaxID=1848903 RepID=UPI001561D6C0|nr:fibronectin type III domain-containing protein [Capnocytophaga canis]